MLLKSLALLTVTILLGTGCGSTPSIAPISSSASGLPVATKDIAIIYTNDVHCAVDENIGYAGLEAYKKELQAQGCEVLLVDCGDAIQGAPIGALSKGENIVNIMNKMAYDVAIPGNHEFDYGIDQLKTLADKANFPYLSVNFLNSTTGKTVFAPYVIKEVGGKNICFVGVTTPYTITSSTPAFFQDENGAFFYDFMGDADGSKLYAAVQAAVDSAKAEGADVVVALTHLGIANDSSPYLSSSLIANTTGIDAVLDGHSHSTEACQRVRNKDGNWTLLSQTGTKLTSMGMLLIQQSGNLSAGLVADYTEKDAEMSAYIQEIQAGYAELLGRKVALTTNALTINDPDTDVRIIRNAETNLGNLCADAYRASCDADIGFANGGGIRSSLPVGDVTYGDILAVFPYGNMICKVEATGQEILDALEHSVRMMPEESGAFLQVSGMTFVVDPTIPTPVKVDEKNMFMSIDGARRVSDVQVAGQPLEQGKTYTVASHAYLIKQGGDGYTMFADNNLLQDEFIEDYTTLINYLAKEYSQNTEQYRDSYGEGRIVAKK